MKKLFQYLELSIIDVILVPLLIYMVTTFQMDGAIAVAFGSVIALAVYIFAAGIPFSKLEDKKTKKISALLATALFIIIGIVIVLMKNYDTDGSFWAGMFAFPLTIALWDTASYGDVLFVVLAPLPVLISVLAGIVFSTDKKWIKVVGAVLIIAVMGKGIYSSCVSIYDMFNDESSYVGEDEQIYNAYFDVNGVKYEDDSDVPYYDTDGNKYFWTCDDEGNIYMSILDVSYLSDGTPFDAMGQEYNTK